MNESGLNKLLPVRFVACVFQPVFERSTVVHKDNCSVANDVFYVFTIEQFQMIHYCLFVCHALSSSKSFIVIVDSRVKELSWYCSRAIA